MPDKTVTCQNCQQLFLIETADFLFYERMKIPAPTFCPSCRFERRLLFRNNRVFYRGECGLCKQPLLSVYSGKRNFIVYCRECWLSDKWTPTEYGQEYDFNIPFFEQFKKLQERVPRSNLYQTNFISSEYCNYGKDLKECYLVFGGINNERLMFANQVFDSRDSLDVAFSEKIEFSYEIFECAKTNLLFFSNNSNDCVDSAYLTDCRNCINCFGCVGLVNKQYCIWNVQYSKDEYERIVKELRNGSYETHVENLKKVNELKLKLPHRYARIYKSINASGDDLSEVRNVQSSFSSRQAENSKFLFFCRNNTKETYDTSFQGFNAELLYEIAHGFGGSNQAFGMRNFTNQDARYNVECHDCKDIFGCEGLRKKQYCILNKQYTKKEYEELVPKIIEQMNNLPYVDSKNRVYKYGEFFPSDLSPFAYNETIAQEYFPLTKQEAEQKGYEWKDAETRNYKIDIENENIPDNINEIDESILGKVISCAHKGTCREQCTEAFKIIPEEFKFYKRMNLPIPRLCPNCRHYERINVRNPLKLWDRACMCNKTNHFHEENKCGIKFKTTYAPDRKEIVYCEKCYQQEVY